MRCATVWLSIGLAFAQGTSPKPLAAEYEVHGRAGSLDIGAEYMVHSFSAGEEMYIAEDYLVVEIALYPLMKDDPLPVDLDEFKLRLNRKTVIQPHQPAQAAASLTYRPWQTSRQSPGLSGGVGAGPLGIPIGRQPGPPIQQGPRPPRAPEADPGRDISRQKARPEEVLMQTALPTGQQKGKISGFIFFPYRGKTSGLKTVELEFRGTTLTLK